MPAVPFPFTPTAGPADLLAAVQAVVGASAPPGPVGIAPSLLEHWRVGRVLVEYRERWWRREKEEPPPRPSRAGTIWFPYRELVLQHLAKRLKAGYNRQSLSACLAYAYRHPTSAMLPRNTAWTVIKMGCDKERQRKRRASRAATTLPPAALSDLLWAMLPVVLPGCHVYQAMAAESTLGRSMAIVQTSTGQIFTAAVIIADPESSRAGPEHRRRPETREVPAVELRVSADQRWARLLWTRRAPASWGVELSGAVWLGMAQERARTDPYDEVKER